jgi:hypothetical protein
MVYLSMDFVPPAKAGAFRGRAPRLKVGEEGNGGPMVHPARSLAAKTTLGIIDRR